MTRRTYVLTVLTLVASCIYLFVDAPPPLDSEREVGAGQRTFAIEEVLRTVAAENAAIRAMFTAEIVGEGPARGLVFNERWRETTMNAGPLPALFLRTTAEHIARSDLPLGFFLGSPMAIAKANSFQGQQAERFEVVARDRAPVFFLDETTGRHTAMFPDLASVPACVSCHNEHPDSALFGPKTATSCRARRSSWTSSNAAWGPLRCVGC
ncbi:MAG: hypothetical protein EXR76_03835 [Myxococcales bacterium]|nr:hypothetical protein [Myxococcales bacterium]